MNIMARPKTSKAERLQAREKRAQAAAGDLAASATLHRGGLEAELDPQVLLSTALTAAPTKLIAIEGASGEPIAFERWRLIAARKALRGFEDLRIVVDWDGLHFAWRKGYGGWNLPPVLAADVRGGAHHYHDRFTVRVPGLRIEREQAA